MEESRTAIHKLKLQVSDEIEQTRVQQLKLANLEKQQKVDQVCILFFD